MGGEAGTNGTRNLRLGSQGGGMPGLRTSEKNGGCGRNLFGGTHTELRQGAGVIRKLGLAGETYWD